MSRLIGRNWHTEIDPDRISEYERFAHDVSLPMFRAQPGLVGVVMLRDGARCQVITLWTSHEAIAALEKSPLYRTTVARIVDAGFLRGEQHVELFDAHLVSVAGATTDQA